MPHIRAPADLPELVKAAFSKARRDGDLHYFPTQVTILTANSIPFQLRYSPALANKPKGPPPDPASPHRPIDPFDDPPPALRLTDVGPAHFLVLNKFAVVPEHFILATKPFKPQTHLLEAPDLEATLACIHAYEDARTGADAHNQHGLFAFFNSGDHSGASQPHRHIQLLPISRMRDGLDPATPWTVMADRLGPSSSSLSHRAPFATFTEAIRLGMPAGELHAAYLRLYRRAWRAVTRYSTTATTTTTTQGTGEAPGQGEALMSYNMAMTKSTLVLSPRVAEGAKIVAPDGHVLGSLSLNGTVLAGTALVKSELEWEVLKRDADGLARVLRGIGIPSEEVDECDGNL